MNRRRSVGMTIVLMVGAWVAWCHGAWGADDSVQGYIAALQSADPTQRSQAIQQLGQLGPKAAQAVPALVSVLGDQRTDIRTAAARALGAIQSAPKIAVGPLAGLLKDKDASVRWAAANALGAFGADAAPAKGALTAATKDPDIAVGTIARTALAKIQSSLAERLASRPAPGAPADGGKAPTPATPSAGPATRLRKGDASLQGYITALKDSRSSERREAILSLGQLGPKAADAVPDLVAILGDEDGNVRMLAILSLGRIRSAPEIAVGPLAGLLKDESERVRMAAADALGAFGAGAAPAKGALTTATKDKNIQVADAAETALRRIRFGLGEKLGSLPAPGAKGNSSGLLSRMARESRWKMMPGGGATIMQDAVADGVPVDRAIAALTEVLQDPHSDEHRDAADALATFGPEAAAAVPALIAAWKGTDSGMADTIELALGDIGAPAAPALTTAMKSNDKSLRFRAACALARCGPTAGKAALPVLQDALKSSETCRTAVYALGRLRAAAAPAVPALVGLLASDKSDARDAAIDSLGRIGPPAKAAVPKLGALLTGRVRGDAAQALAQIGGEEAVKILTQALKIEQARPSAAKALGDIGMPAKAAVPALTGVLEKEPDLEIVGETGNGFDTIRAIGERDVDVLLLDITMPGLPGAPGGISNRIAIAFALANLGRTDLGLPPLIELLDRPEASAAITGAEYLGRLGAKAKQAIPALRRAAVCDDDHMRDVAREALRQIRDALAKP
ncbi:MAG: HEAT repeat domain-containing protein [Planctomycetota bacterium]|nr:HEAT repeat domain-containing protein [Planctomycetota bacterium]